MHDFHTHFIPGEVMLWIKKHSKEIHAEWIKKDPDKAVFLSINGKWAFELKDEFIDASLYFHAKEKAGVAHSLISPIPQLFLYDFPAEITSELATVYNKSLATWSKTNPEQLSALATVPLNDPEKAAEELRSAIDLGLKGAIIGPGLGEQLLTHSSFTPFWEEANRLGAIIFIHPLLCEDPRLKQRMMPNLIGVPWETTICAADILLSGLLDRYTKVKILLAHGGGFLPYQIGRLSKGYAQWTAISKALNKEPLEYLKDFWYDSVLWNPDTLEYLASIVGTERIVPGSDYPFDLCSWPPAEKYASGASLLLNR